MATESAGARRRAEAAVEAFRLAISDTGVRYSPRDWVAAIWGEAAADYIERQIANSAANPGHSKNKIVIRHRPTFFESPINFNRYQDITIEHFSIGEIRGVEEDITQRYRSIMKNS